MPPVLGPGRKLCKERASEGVEIGEHSVVLMPLVYDGLLGLHVSGWLRGYLLPHILCTRDALPPATCAMLHRGWCGNVRGPSLTWQLRRDMGQQGMPGRAKVVGDLDH